MDKQLSRGQLDIRAIDDGDGYRFLAGTMTTGKTDRVGDRINPMGAIIEPPISLLWFHDPEKIVGSVTKATPSPTGIAFEAYIAKPRSDGPFAELCAKAWQAVREKLVRSVSIGFVPVERQKIDTGWLFTRYHLTELSLTSTPCNPSAQISVFRSLDHADAISSTAKRTASPKSYLAIWLERMTHDANCALFKGRPFTIEYHDGPTVGALAFPRRRAISFHERLLDMPDHKLMAIAIHELAHLACAGEREEHGPTWRRAMQMRGVDPDTGEILHGSPARHFVDTYK